MCYLCFCLGLRCWEKMLFIESKLQNLFFCSVFLKFKQKCSLTVCTHTLVGVHFLSTSEQHFSKMLKSVNASTTSHEILYLLAKKDLAILGQYNHVISMYFIPNIVWISFAVKNKLALKSGMNIHAVKSFQGTYSLMLLSPLLFQADPGSTQALAH